MEIENKSEGKSLLFKTKETKDLDSENSKLLNDIENGKESVVLDVNKSKKNNSKSHSSIKGNTESQFESNNAGLCDQRESLTNPQNLKENSEDSSQKERNPCSLENVCKGNKNETNANIALTIANTNSTLSDETLTTEKNIACSDSPEF